MSASDRRLAVMVHRVRTSEEVDRFVQLGVDYVGFHVDDDVVYNFDPDPLYADDRYLLLDDLPDLAAHLGGASGMAQIGADQWSAELPAALAGDGITAIHVPARQPLDPDIAAACTAAGLQLVIGDVALDPEDAPMLAERTAVPPGTALLEVQLFPSYGDAWHYLDAVSERHAPDSVTFADIEAIAARVPLFLALNVTPGNAAAIVNRLAASKVRGLSFTLAGTQLGSAHTYDVDQAVEAIQAIRAR